MENEQSPTQREAERIESRIDGIEGLVNIYRAITGKDCPRHLALGMATSAVSSLRASLATAERERDEAHHLLDVAKDGKERRARQFVRLIPDKYLAIALFLVVLGLYLWTKDSLLEKMVFGLYSLVCIGIADGLRRVTTSFQERLKRDGATKGDSK